MVTEMLITRINELKKCLLKGGHVWQELSITALLDFKLTAVFGFNFT